MRVVFWQKIMSHHQASVIRRLAMKDGVRVEWVVEKLISDERRALGWPVPDDIEPCILRVDPTEDQIDRIIADDPKHTTHIFTGIRSDRIASNAYRKAIKTNATIGLLVEPPFPDGLKNVATPILGRLFRYTLGAPIKFILAIGAGAVDCYRSWGFTADQVFPYGYFIPRLTTVPLARTDNQVHIVFIGSCMPRKGGDLLISAINNVKSKDWILSIVGDGPYRAEWEILSRKCGRGDQFRFHGALPHTQTMDVLSTADLCVVPSRHDGWGAVVNEALVRGIPVICTSACGANVLMQHDYLGAVVRKSDINQLTRELEKRIHAGPLSMEQSQRIMEWSSNILPDKAADYIYDVLLHVTSGSTRPTPIWLAE